MIWRVEKGDILGWTLLLVNPTSNVILDRIHQVLVHLMRTFNITETYVDEDDPRSGILAAVEFTILSTTDRL